MRPILPLAANHPAAARPRRSNRRSAAEFCSVGSPQARSRDSRPSARAGADERPCGRLSRSEARASRGRSRENLQECTPANQRKKGEERYIEVEITLILPVPREKRHDMLVGGTNDERLCLGVRERASRKQG